MLFNNINAATWPPQPTDNYAKYSFWHRANCSRFSEAAGVNSTFPHFPWSDMPHKQGEGKQNVNIVNTKIHTSGR